MGKGALNILRCMSDIFKIPTDLTPKTKPNYSKPIEIASFSYDSNRIFHPNRSELVNRRKLPLHILI